MRIVRLSPAKNSRFFSCAHSFERITNENLQKKGYLACCLIVVFILPTLF